MCRACPPSPIVHRLHPQDQSPPAGPPPGTAARGGRSSLGNGSIWTLLPISLPHRHRLLLACAGVRAPGTACKGDRSVRACGWLAPLAPCPPVRCLRLSDIRWVSSLIHRWTPGCVYSAAAREPRVRASETPCSAWVAAPPGARVRPSAGFPISRQAAVHIPGFLAHASNPPPTENGPEVWSPRVWRADFGCARVSDCTRRRPDPRVSWVVAACTGTWGWLGREFGGTSGLPCTAAAQMRSPAGAPGRFRRAGRRACSGLRSGLPPFPLRWCHRALCTVRAGVDAGKLLDPSCAHILIRLTGILSSWRSSCSACWSLLSYVVYTFSPGCFVGFTAVLSSMWSNLSTSDYVACAFRNTFLLFLFWNFPEACYVSSHVIPIYVGSVFFPFRLSFCWSDFNF